MFIKSTILLSIITIFSTCSFASDKNIMYFELGGNSANFYSLNYERELANNLYSRLGYSQVQRSENTVRRISEYNKKVNVQSSPVMLNYLIGEGPHKAELGFGVVGIKSNKPVYLEKFSEDKANKTFVLETATIGYRYQPKIAGNSSGWMFKAGYTPVFNTHNIKNIAGLSIGKSF